ncbi:MAG: hypothetical protein ACP5KE_06550 [Candidatus Methanodesulfokora sp.]|jgi:hypothetical protein
MGIFEDCMKMKADELKSVLQELGVKQEGLKLDSKEVKTAICRLFEAAFEGTEAKEAAHATALWKLRGKLSL